MRYSKSTPKQKLARDRSWNLLRLRGFCLNVTVMTDKEKELAKKHREIIDELDSIYEEESKKLGIKIVKYNIYFNKELWKEKVTYAEARSYKDFSTEDEVITYKKIEDEV